MTELEILAQLKWAYNSLEDIVNNASDTQLNKNDIDILCNTMNKLNIIYDKEYQKIKNENGEKLKWEDNVYVSNDIENDFMIKSEDFEIDYISYDQTDKNTKWYEDLEFLLN